MIDRALDLVYRARISLFGVVIAGAVAISLMAVGVVDADSARQATVSVRRSAEGLLGLTTAVAPNVTVSPAIALSREKQVPHGVPVGLTDAVSTEPQPPAHETEVPTFSPVAAAVQAPAAPTLIKTPPAEEPPAKSEEPPAKEEEPAPPKEEPKSPPKEEPKSPPKEEPKQEEPKQEPPPKEEPKQEPPPAEEPTGVPALFEAGFEEGLEGWNIAGVGEVVPKVTTAIVREGEFASTVVLTGTEDRSELILGGNGTGSTAGTKEFSEGDEYWYGFSFYISSMVYGHPGAHNLIMQFKSDGTGSPLFGLQLWDVNGEKGLWTAGEAMEIDHSGERFLAVAPEDVWHDVQIHFKASEVGAGFYEVFLDGNLVDAQTGVTMIVPGRKIAYIKTGLYRNGDEIPGTSELEIDAAKLGTTRESVLP